MMTEKRELDAQLSAVLEHLPGWTLDPNYNDHAWCAVLIDGTGKGIHVNATQAKGRLCISGTWPTDSEHRLHGPDKHLRITIARDRPPEKIAADIQRRFLQWYTAAYAEQVERVKQHNAVRTRRQEVAVELAALLGQEASRQLQSETPHIHAHGLTVDVNGGDSVTIQLRYASVKVAKVVIRAFVKAGGLAD